MKASAGKPGSLIQSCGAGHHQLGVSRYALGNGWEKALLAPAKKGEEEEIIVHKTKGSKPEQVNPWEMEIPKSFN